LRVEVSFSTPEAFSNLCTGGKPGVPLNPGLGILKEFFSTLIQPAVKAHGCVSDPSKIVLSRSSYFSARRDFPGFYELLDALFLTNTLLFVGYSLSDPDIQLVLENANISAPSAHPHYALVEKTRHPSIKSAIKKNHNIELVEYPRGNHAAAVDAMTLLRDKVIAFRSTVPYLA